jgi:CspA family cold shock protein
VVQGIVKWFDCKRGYGFLNRPNDDRDIFVHYTSIEGEGFRSLRGGESVEFDLVEGDKGPQAKHVRRLTRAKRPRTRQPKTKT